MPSIDLEVPFLMEHLRSWRPAKLYQSTTAMEVEMEGVVPVLMHFDNQMGKW